MLNREWKQFKSGTDIRGVAVEYKENKVNLTDDAVRAMAGGFVLWLSNKVGKKPIELKISVGRDSRISGEHILGLCADVMKESGAEVIDCGLSSTPAMFMTTVDLACDGALQITASHHPFYRNGLKFFTDIPSFLPSLKALIIDLQDLPEILAFLRCLLLERRIVGIVPKELS